MTTTGFKKCEIEILELKNTLNEIKMQLESINSRIDQVEQFINIKKLFENMHSEEKKVI